MNLARLAVEYRAVVFTAVGLLIAWGAVTFFTMPRREDPEFTVRTCVVSTSWPGAPTVKVEELVTDPLEEALDSIEEVEQLRSTTVNGLSTIYVDVEPWVSADAIQNTWDKVRAKVDLVAMPASGVRPIVDDSFGDTAILLLGVYQCPLDGSDQVDPRNRYSQRRLEIYADQIRDALRLAPGVAEVKKYGVNDEAIYIETDLGTWSQISLTTESLRQLVAARNIVSPGGDIDTAEGRFMVKPGGEFDAVREIESITVGTVASGQTNNQVRLDEIGMSVRRAYQDPADVICRVSDPTGSYPAITIGVTMKAGQNIINVCRSCQQRVRQMVEVEQVLPRDIAVAPVSDLSDNVEQKINEVIENVIAAIVIVVVVVYACVGLRTSLVMAASIPLVVLSSIAVIALFGVELEQISLASIIIALGLLVDNAVQVCDQTRTNLARGMEPNDAAVEAATVLAFPMLSGTLTTIAAFFPMLIALEGGTLEYVYSLPVTMTVTLGLSWFLAMTFCVILSAMIIRPARDPDAPSSPIAMVAHWVSLPFKRRPRGTQADGDAPTAGDGALLKLYRWTALLAVRMKWITVAAAFGLLYACVSLPVSTEFFPQDKKDQFYVNVTTPETSTIAQTDAKIAAVEAALRKLSPATDAAGNPVERVRYVCSIIGRGGARWNIGVDPPTPATNNAQLLVRTTSADFTAGLYKDLRRVIDQGDASLGIRPITGARVTAKQIFLGPPADPLVVRITGSGFADIDQMRRVTSDVSRVVRSQPETWDVHDSWGVDGLQVFVDVDEEQANLAGVTNANVADTLDAYFAGVQLTTFREGDHLIPVYFRLRPEDRTSLSGFYAAFVEGSNGKIPLNSIASVSPRWEPAKVERRDLNRVVEVSSEVSGAPANDVALRVMNSDRMKQILADLPPGYRIELGGSYEESVESSAKMATALGIAMLMIVLILVVQYNGWSKTLIILATLPLAVSGAMFGLWATDNMLGFMPQLGLLSLFGIVLNTGIIFVEFADILIGQRVEQKGDAANGPICGLTPQEFRECLAQAGAQRLLPIFLTTATTVGGLLPLALSGGPLWEGMAWLMIFGLLVATVMTLYVLPALYAIFVETLGVKPIKA